jgi:hypothetical protein
MLGTTFPMHNFWAVSDPQMKQADMINFLKNTALVRALLMLLAIPQPWPFSLASRLVPPLVTSRSAAQIRDGRLRHSPVTLRGRPTLVSRFLRETGRFDF